MYLGLFFALSAFYLQGLVVWSFQVNVLDLKGYFVRKWIDFF